MYVQAGVSARCGQILRLRAGGQQAMGKGMRTEGERGKWKLEGERGTGRCCASGANCFAQQRAAGGGKKAARTDGSFKGGAEEAAACRCLRLNDVNCSQTATTTMRSRDKENSEAAN